MAIERGRQRRAAGLRATAVRYLADLKLLLVGFADDSAIALPVSNYPELKQLSRKELEGLELGFAGSALCLNAKDLQVSIEGLVSASQPLMALAASVVAARNGRRVTAAKSKASQLNGQKGGRPRKTAVIETT